MVVTSCDEVGCATPKPRAPGSVASAEAVSPDSKQVRAHDECTRPVEDKDFGFPFIPYPSQRELMAKTYDIIHRGGVGIFESPTGTGKTLSLLCPALAWLKHNERVVLEEAVAPPPEEGREAELEDWALEFQRSNVRNIADHIWARRRQQRQMRRTRDSRAMVLTSAGKPQREKIRKVDVLGLPPPPDEGDFSLEAPLDLPKPEEPPPLDEEVLRDAYEHKVQIIYCSRTHSQLAQVLSEIQRIAPVALPDGLSVVTLGARSNLCVHDGVRARARGSPAQLNELCRLATDRGEKVGGCTLKKNAQALTDACLTNMLNVEDMCLRGRAPVGGGCPYYGSRWAAPEADVLLVPYPSLVNTEMRRKLGIRTKGNVLIFDEAHNLLEAIGESNSVTLSAPQASASVDDLAAYACRYEGRLSPGNAMHLRQLRQLCVQLHKHLATLKKAAAQTVGAFLLELGVDHFDLPALSNFLERTELPRKVRGYAESIRVGGAAKPNAASSIYCISAFLGALLQSTGDDRIIAQPNADEPAFVRYLSLDPEVRFRDLVTSARSVIFTGGTLEPRNEFASLYTAKLGLSNQITLSDSGKSDGMPKISHFAGRHVVPDEHIFARYVTHGPAGHMLDFRRDTRNSDAQLSELRAILATTAAATPGGCVVFFPSFEYLGAVAPPAGARLGGREVFVERRAHSGGASGGNRTEATDVGALTGENLLRGFSAAVQAAGGAVLLAVSGGKLSEGINFRDGLCRLVVVVGLPYPNASDLALLEKMKFLDACRAKGAPGLSGREFYMARCMKGVNQCVGRSIRHSRDWAAALLLDHRYAQPNISGAISIWLRERASSVKFADANRELQRFFAERGGDSGVVNNDGSDGVSGVSQARA